MAAFPQKSFFHTKRCPFNLSVCRSYGLPIVSSQDVRRVLKRETMAMDKDMAELFLAYLGQSEEGGDSSHVLTELQTTVVAMHLDVIARWVHFISCTQLLYLC